MKNIYPAEQEYQTGSLDQNAVLKLLREKGYRITKQRENLLHIIMEENCSSCGQTAERLTEITEKLSESMGH